MPISGIVQPETIMVDEGIRLRRFDGKYDFAYEWYQNEETVWLMDGCRELYDWDKLERMYRYLDEHGELYFIEVKEADGYIPIGDVTFWQEDMPIVIGDLRYRQKGIGAKVVGALIQRGKSLGYPYLLVSDIYEYNIASRKTFTSQGFVPCKKTEKGSGYRREL